MHRNVELDEDSEVARNVKQKSKCKSEVENMKQMLDEGRVVIKQVATKKEGGE